MLRGRQLSRFPTPITVDGSVRRAAVIALAYFVADLLLNKLVLFGDGWLMFWPLNGVTVALLLARPRREWAPLIVMVGITTTYAEYLSGNDDLLLWMGSFTYPMEVLLGAVVLPPFITLESWLRSPGLYLRFALVVLLGPLLVSSINAGGYWLVDGVPFLAKFLDLAPSEVIGLATMIPLVLAARSVTTLSLRQLSWWARVIGVLGATGVIMTLMFETRAFPLLFLLYPLLFLAESLLGLLGSSLALCCACILAAGLTEAGYGPFVHALSSRRMAVELYLAFHLISFLPVSILMTERRFLMHELRASLEHATTLAAVDALTGLSNRRTFDHRLREYWRIAVRTQVPLALLMIDADHFKLFNDRLGHQAGDDCLRELAKTLKGHARRANDIAARYGGEEFALLLLDCSPEDACKIGEAIRTAVFSMAIAHPGASDTGRVTVSVGCVSLTPQRDTPIKQLIARADRALYLAKDAGRNRVCGERPEGEGRVAPALTRLRERLTGAGRGH